MEKIEIFAQRRDERGKGPARRLRAAGKIPAVFYGKKAETVNLTLDLHELNKALDQATSNPLFDLKIQGHGGEMTRTAILKERQVNPVNGALVHLDFIQVFMDVVIEVSVPLEFVGKPAGVDKGGSLQAASRDLRVACLPSSIPGVIQVDVSGLEIGHSIHIGEIPLPPGVEVVQDKGTALATVLAPKRPEEMVEAEVTEAAEPGEKPAAGES